MWHRVALVIEERRLRLYVDGLERASQAVTVPERPLVAGSLVIGGLVEGGLGCRGEIDEVRVSSGAHAIEGTLDGELPVEATTLGWWRFDGAYSFDFGAWMQSGVDSGLTPGTSVFTQYCYRDPSSGSMTGFSNSLQFVVLP